jgi:hypothetical protein
VAFVLEIEQVVAKLLLGDLIGGLVEVVVELLDDAELSLLSSLDEPGELEILVHAPAKQSGHQRSLSKRGEGGPSTVWKPLCHRPRRASGEARMRSTHFRRPELRGATRKAEASPAA